MTRNKSRVGVSAWVSLSVALAACVAECAEAGKDGGMLPRPAKGVVRYYNYQNKITSRDLMGFFLVNDSPIRLNFEYRAMTNKFDICQAAKVMGDANVAIFVVDDPDLPMSLVAMEGKWGLVNVRPLMADHPKTLTLLQRADKLVTRVGTTLLGGANCLHMSFSAMQPVYSLEDLDRMTGRAIAPPSLTQIMYTLDKLGLRQVQDCTYEEACIEGWAPAPTNDVQKAIWDEIHALPTEPIKITPETKKVTE